MKQKGNKKESAITGARRMLHRQYLLMRDQLPGIRERDPEALHQYRVALRRFRAALKLFRKEVNLPGTLELDAALADLSDRLGALRDVQVRGRFLLVPEFADRLDRKSRGELESEIRAAARQAVRIMESPECMEAAARMERLLQIDLPELERKGKRRVSCRHRLERELSRQIAKIKKSGHRIPWDDAPALHAFRKKCRRGRYYAEFAAPLLGRRVRRLAKALKKAAGALGDFRDIVLLQNAATIVSGAAGEERYFIARQAECREQFAKAWAVFLEFA